MFGISHHCKVFQPIVESVAVDVMNDVAFGDWPIDLFPNKAVRSAVLSVTNRSLFVSSVYGRSALPVWVIRACLEFVPTPSAPQALSSLPAINAGRCSTTVQHTYGDTLGAKFCIAKPPLLVDEFMVCCSPTCRACQSLLSVDSPPSPLTSVMLFLIYHRYKYTTLQGQLLAISRSRLSHRRQASWSGSSHDRSGGLHSCEKVLALPRALAHSCDDQTEPPSSITVVNTTKPSSPRTKTANTAVMAKCRMATSLQGDSNITTV